MKLNSVLTLLFIALFTACKGGAYDLSGYGLKPDTGENASPLIAKALQEIAAEVNFDTVRILLPKGRYDFYPEGASKREYFISNHDQDNPKLVGLAFENMKNVIFDGQGSELVFHGRMLPVSLVGSENCTLKNFSIDFANPHISQVKVLENDTVGGLITYEVAPWVEYEIRDSNFVAKGEGWEHVPAWGIAFEGDTKRLVYTTSDISVGSKHVAEIASRKILAPWKNKKLIPGTVVVFRGYGRPTPGVFMYHDTNTTLENIQVHYAEGMGLLAQMSENITLDKFSVCLRGKDDPRYFTTQADATHFSGCKGLIRSVGGLYEGMMDDAINVHSTCLGVMEVVDSHTLKCKYMHRQAVGFEVFLPGEKIRFINGPTLEPGGTATVKTAVKKNSAEMVITVEEPLPSSVRAGDAVENADFYPSVVFRNNIVRNNRARGSLFTTPERVLVEGNLFDHSSGSAILLAGDAQGWYESGACHEVVIRKNTFINNLTSRYQFTNAIISIYPEVKQLDRQRDYYHRNVLIENNVFKTFDVPLLFAISTDNLKFINNKVIYNDEFKGWGQKPFQFRRCANILIKDNKVLPPRTWTLEDCKLENTPSDQVRFGG